MELLATALRSAARSVKERPGFSLVVVSILALAIAGNATMFGLLDAALLDSLPFEQPDRLITVDVLSTKGFYISTSIPNYRDWRDGGRVFERWGASAGWYFTLTGEGPAEVVSGRAVLGDFFEVLGIEAASGRTIPAAATEPGGAAVVVLGHRAWRSRFGADPEILGEAIQLDGRPHVVVGVLGPGSGYPSPETAAYVPMGSIPGLPWDDRDSSFGTRALARLAPGRSVEQARQDLARVHREIEEREGGPVGAPEVEALEDHFVGESRGRLWLLAGAVLCVLLIAAANVTNLLLVRTEERSAELDVRRALGAGRWQVAAPILGEGLLLAFAGGAAGLGLAHVLAGAARPLLTRELPSWVEERFVVEWGVALFTLLATSAVGIASSLAAAFGGGPADLAARLRAGAGARSSGRRSGLRAVLVAGQVAAAMVLLVAGSLLFTSFRELRSVDLGFDPEGVLTARVSQPDSVSDREGWLRFYGGVEERVEALPGVRSAALSLLVPLSQRSWEMILHPEGRDARDPEAGESVLFGIVSESYFETLGVPLLRGRAFLPSDREGSVPVAVIDETMAATLWPGEDPLGKRITVQETTEADEPLYRMVVGVAANVRHYAVESPSRIQVYVPFRQSGERWGMGLSLVARTEIPPELALEPVRRTVTALDADAAVYSARPLEALVGDALAPRRAVGLLVAGFAGLALVLAVLGVFGLVSRFVAQRFHEAGIRMALGADGRSVMGWVASRGLRLTGLGVLAGAAGAAAASRLLGRFLFGVDPLSPAHYLVPAAAILLAALLASALPASRAARTDPSAVLRR